MSTFPNIKLTYFYVAGRAEHVRLALHIGGVPFVDERISYPAFMSAKASYPFGQLPILEVDGHVFAQSQAMLRYAGRLAKLYPSNDPVAALWVDEIISGVEEAQEMIAPTYHEPDAKKKKAMRLELAESTLPRYLSILEARLATCSKYPSLQTKDVLIHETALFTLVRSLRTGYIDHIPVTVADGYPLIEQRFQKVANHPKVREWYSIDHNVSKLNTQSLQKVANHPKVQEWFAIQHNTPKLKLTYFPRPGRGEPIRLALFLGGIEFEDERVTPEELALRKPELPFNQLPVLEVDGDVIAQSLAILRYVGSLSGLYPTTNPVEAFHIDELFCLIDDLHNIWGPSFREKDPEKQLALRKVLAEETIPKFLGHLDKRTAQHSSGPYAIGAKLTVADLAIAALLNGLKSGHMVGVPATVVDPFTNLLKIRELVHAHPKVVEWYQTHADH